MNIFESIAATLRQAGIDPGIGLARSAAVRRGWDYRTPVRRVVDGSPREPTDTISPPSAKPYTDGDGIARVVHRYLLGSAKLPQHSLPIFSRDMNATELLSGIWRQCFIWPGDDAIQFGNDPYAVSSIDADCCSSPHLITLLGHQPRDLALWLDDLRKDDPKLFLLILAKDFKGALHCAPDLVERRWPSSVSDRWTEHEGNNLPPFLVSVLYAELARLAMNQSGLLALSFDRGIELTSKRFLERVRVSGGVGAVDAADRAIAQSPFQSHALGLPDVLIGGADITEIAAWVRTAASSLALGIGQTGAIDIAPRHQNRRRFSPPESRRIRNTFQRNARRRDGRCNRARRRASGGWAGAPMPRSACSKSR